MIKYNSAICGGTFDLLHEGHKKFLKRILEIFSNVVIGLTSDEYVEREKPDRGIVSFEIRKKEIIKFLKKLNAEKRVKIIKINDMYGPLLDPNFKAEALAIASDKYDSALIINKERKERGIPPIKIIEIPLVRAEDKRLLSATRIREGYINRKGKLLLPSALRKKLQKPLGKLLIDIPGNLFESKIITVGDVTTDRFISQNYSPRLSIVDFRVGRKPIPPKEFKGAIVVRTANPAGTISFELFNRIKSSFKDSVRKVIIVEGEEDLAVLPAMLFAPIGYEIYYGQPNKGLVQIKITQKEKNKAKLLLSSFEGV